MTSGAEPIETIEPLGEPLWQDNADVIEEPCVPDGPTAFHEAECTLDCSRSDVVSGEAPAFALIEDVASDATSSAPSSRGAAQLQEAVRAFCQSVEPGLKAAAEAFEEAMSRHRPSASHFLVIAYRAWLIAEENPDDFGRLAERHGLRFTRHARRSVNEVLQLLHRAAGLSSIVRYFASSNAKRLERMRAILDDQQIAASTALVTVNDDTIAAALTKVLEQERLQRKKRPAAVKTTSPAVARSDTAGEIAHPTKGATGGGDKPVGQDGLRLDEPLGGEGASLEGNTSSAELQARETTGLSDTTHPGAAVPELWGRIHQALHEMLGAYRHIDDVDRELRTRPVEDDANLRNLVVVVERFGRIRQAIELIQARAIR